jgi:hypothetical protein
MHAYLRLTQREWTSIPPVRERFRAGFYALAWTTFNLALCLTLGTLRALPMSVSLAFLLQWVETLWGLMNPAIGVKPVLIGVRQLIVSILFTLIFIITWG